MTELSPDRTVIPGVVTLVVRLGISRHQEACDVPPRGGLRQDLGMQLGVVAPGPTRSRSRA